MKKAVFISIVCLLGTMTGMAETTLQSISTMEPMTAMVKGAEASTSDELIAMETSTIETESVENSSAEALCGDSISSKTITTTMKTDSSSVANQTSQQIVLKKGRYYVNDQKLKGRDLKNLLNSDPESAAIYAKAQSINTTGILLLIAVDVALVLTTGYIIGVLPAILITLPFSSASQKHMTSAIAIYNSKHSYASNRSTLPAQNGQGEKEKDQKGGNQNKVTNDIDFNLIGG